MGIETNFGTYVGKMDIISSLATLSFDQRRSEFFNTSIALKVISLRFPMGVETIYKLLEDNFIL